MVEQINLIYHSFDADHYDSDIAEMRRTWPALWDEMLRQLPPGRSWRVLDFGCGTGFEAGQVLRRLGGKLYSLVAYDQSVQMLDKARSKIGDPRVILTTDKSDIKDRAPFDLLITNSVLHHLPEI